MAARRTVVKPRRANEIIEQVVEIVRGWRGEAKRARIPGAQQDRMTPAFRLTEAA